MTPSKFRFRGKSAEELRSMSIEDFRALVNSRHRRSMKRGLTEQQKTLLENIRKNPKKFHKTHCRDLLILPEMLGVKLGVHNGKEFVPVEIRPEMLGHRLGDMVMSRRLVKHSAPGFGATRSSKFVPLK
jgi:small subunit ribosomal protein S19